MSEKKSITLDEITGYAISEAQRRIDAGEEDSEDFNLTDLEEDVQNHFNMEDKEFEERDISWEIYQALVEAEIIED